MNQFEVILKQHTPLIHFQHDQDGATLRASEVKPKLDRFIISRLSEERSYPDGLQIAHQQNWLIGINSLQELDINKQYALNYKLKFVPTELPKISYINEPIVDRNGKEKLKSYPLFFANMDKKDGDKEVKKFSFTTKPIKAVFFCSGNDLEEIIKEHIADFFFLNNFGTRQSKGFGSFYPEDSEQNKPCYKPPAGNIYFDVITKDVKEVFNQIDLFYRTLRGGINIKIPQKDNNGRTLKDENGRTIMRDRFYFKSLMFLYGRHLGIQWEKKKIKEVFFPKDLRDQQDERDYLFNKDNFPLFYSSPKIHLLKDLLGLSSVESWLSYDKSIITKTEAKQVNGHFVKIEREADLSIARIKSPFCFKVIEKKDGCYTVYMFIDQEMEQEIKEKVLNKTFIISCNGDEIPLSFPDKFSYTGFLDFILKGSTFNIDKHVEKRFQSKNEFDILKNIYTQLKAYYK